MRVQLEVRPARQHILDSFQLEETGEQVEVWLFEEIAAIVDAAEGTDRRIEWHHSALDEDAQKIVLDVVAEAQALTRDEATEYRQALGMEA